MKDMLCNQSVVAFQALIVAVAFTMFSCYDDFVENEFEYTAVYLPRPEIERTFIMGEGMQIGVGVVLGGRLSNDRDVKVTFSLNPALVTDGGGAILPENYYTMVGPDGETVTNTITIPAGKVQGFVYVKADSATFLADPRSLGHNYAMAFQLDDVEGADSILVNFTTAIISFSYINQLYGNYMQLGRITRTENGDPIEPITYAGGIEDIVKLTMYAPDTLIVNGLGEFRGNKNKMKIAVRPDDAIAIVSLPGATPVIDDGGSKFDRKKREVILNYTFELNNIVHTARDTLDFRNRVVDGVNQFDI